MLCSTLPLPPSDASKVNLAVQQKALVRLQQVQRSVRAMRCLVIEERVATLPLYGTECMFACHATVTASCQN